MNSTVEPESERAHSTERKIDAPCNIVYSAFSNPKQLATWWGPKGFSNTFEEFNLQKGGYWRFTMHGPDGKDYWNESVFIDVVPNERVTLEHFSGHHFFLTISFHSVGDATLVRWQQVFDSIEHYQRIASFVSEANEQNLDRLAVAVERILRT